MLENVKTLGMNVFHMWEGPDLWTGKGWNVDEVVCCTTLKGMYSGARPLRVTRTEGHQILWTETPQRKEHQRTALSTEWGSALFLILAVIGLPTSSTFSPLRIEVSIILSHPVYCVLWCRTKLRWHSKIQVSLCAEVDLRCPWLIITSYGATFVNQRTMWNWCNSACHQMCKGRVNGRWDEFLNDTTVQQIAIECLVFKVSCKTECLYTIFKMIQVYKTQNSDHKFFFYYYLVFVVVTVVWNRLSM